MKKLKLFVLLAIVITSTYSRADEGMWLPFMIGRNMEDMKKHGLKLTQEQIYSINHASIKDAVISFGGFCTGEVISKKGLVLTNHHCGYDAIADASTPEKNYLDKGFWAKNYTEEIPVAGLTATFIVRIEDVTSLIQKELNETMTAQQRADKIAEISKILEKEAVEGTHYEAFVRDFYDGNEFYLFVKETFNDVRLVGTPPQSSGKYGGDTDNWMWPRHTADFSMFRIYSGADNKPANYNTNNQPYTPKHSLPISIDGIKKNDYAMVMGFPGRTNRFLTSYGIEQAIKFEQPKIVEIRAKKLQIMKKYMDQNVGIRLKYSSKYAQVANYWKYFIGQTAQLKNNKVADKKREIETSFNAFTKGEAEYADVLADIEESFRATNPFVYSKVYYGEFLRQVDINANVLIYKTIAKLEAEGKTDYTKELKKIAKERWKEFFSNNNIDIELETLSEVYKMYLKDVPKSQKGIISNKIAEKGASKVDKLIAKIRKKSIFTDKQRFNEFEKNFSLVKLSKDPLFLLIKDIDDAYQNTISKRNYKEALLKLQRANRLFVKGVRAMDLSKNYAPNANSTMRLTYGNVLPYAPKDATYFDYQTTLTGLMQKEDPSNPEFTVDPVMKELWKNKDYGRYANAKGELIVNFLTNNDITGGNSGSPCINANGELIGVAFDGNWEAMSGDIYFEPNIQRTIVCDIRYILWIIDKCYGAQNIIDEMEIIDRPGTSSDEELTKTLTTESTSNTPETKTTCSMFKTTDVYFDLGRHDITSKNSKAIEDVIKILKENPTTTVEVNGHTDLTGDVCKNLILSEKRAKSVERYLISKGIDAKRVISRGYGTAQPIEENKTETGRAHNRRVSFMIK
jgi:outer membrane protein OmpA-like peptidoglycan-associated protein